jgi:endonuclease YncB( thermonuclease family)
MVLDQPSFPPTARWLRQLLPLLLAALLAACAAPGDTGVCAADRSDQRVVSAHIFDGDTLKLADGRTVRLLGINTPETARDGTPSEPFAENATALLARLAPAGASLRLRLDAERFDRYGRTLAHVFQDDGSNVQVQLLEAGYATTLVVPPNEWAVECYAAVEARARARRVGLWGLPRYQPIPAEQLPDTARGFRLVTGRVQRVGESRGNVWLNLSARVAVRIPRDDLVYFGELDPLQLAGRRLEVRGWFYARRGQLRVTVRHPAALKIIE